jgi:hypothetical protein
MPHPLCIQFLRDKGFWKVDPLLTAAAACTRDLPLLKQLHEQGCPWDSDTYGDAANNGKVECLRYAIEHGCPRPAELIIKAAQSSSCMQYLHEIGVSWAQGVTWRAALCLDTNALAYAHEHGCPWDTDTANTAASWANESCLKYALEHNCPTQYDTCNIAAASNLQCLKLVLKHGCVWGTATSAAAAKAGKLECLHWDTATTYAAAEAGKLDCLTYAHEQGCPWAVAWCLGVPFNAQTRRCLEYVRTQAPEEAIKYDALFTTRLHRFLISVFWGCEPRHAGSDVVGALVLMAALGSLLALLVALLCKPPANDQSASPCRTSLRDSY